MKQTNPHAYLPIREPTFYILLSLVPSEKHGYAILKDVAEISGGQTRLTTGTLYEALGRLLEQGLIERSPDGNGKGPGKPRKVYRLSGLGRQVIEAEAARLQQLSTAAQKRIGGVGKSGADR